MTSFQLKVQLTVLDLLQVAEQFSLRELEQFIAQLVQLSAQRQNRDPSSVLDDILLRLATPKTLILHGPTLSPVERAEELRQWADQERPGPTDLPDSAFSRASIYDE